MLVNTGIKANDKYLEILSSVIGQMSDGIWENTRSMEKYWKSLDYETADGNIVLLDKHHVCSDVREFFANKIKQIIKIEIEDGNHSLSWSRDCSATPRYLERYTAITVGDCYELYELLKGRDTTKHTYSSYRDFDVVFEYMGHAFEARILALNEREAKSAVIKKISEDIAKIARVMPV